MGKVSGTVLIEAPIEEVFDYVTTLENRCQFVNGVVATEVLLRTPQRVGAAFQEVREIAGRRLRFRGEVTVYEPRHRYAYLTWVSRLGTHAIWEFTEIPPGTLVRYASDYQLAIAPLGKVVDEVVLVPRYKSCHEKTLQNLKRVLESPPEVRATPVAHEAKKAISG